MTNVTAGCFYFQESRDVNESNISLENHHFIGNHSDLIGYRRCDMDDNSRQESA